jgi:acyl-CoA thioesterase
MTAAPHPDFPFDRETAVRRTGPGRYEADMDRGWWVMQGPNGGYLAAVILRALTDAVDDPARAPRSLTVHYATAPTDGAVSIAVTLERVGRSLTTATARMEQDDRLVALAVAAFSKPRAGVEFCDVVMPQVPPPEHFAALPPPAGAPPIAPRYHTRGAIGAPPSPTGPSHARAVAGGWIRLPEHRPVDALLAAAITDGWLPPMFGRVAAMVAVPTVDLTIHFRAELPHPGLAPDAFVLAAFRSTVAAGGFLEEDGEVWAPDGTLLAQSRQLAVIVPIADRAS